MDTKDKAVNHYRNLEAEARAYVAMRDALIDCEKWIIIEGCDPSNGRERALLADIKAALMMVQS